MKTIIQKMDKLLESRIRLGILSALVVNDSLDFNALKKLMEVTDGNLSSNISTLEQNRYIKIRKRFINKKSNTSLTITKTGRKAFHSHLSALEEMIRNISK